MQTGYQPGRTQNRQGQGRNVQETKKRNNEIINNLKQTLSKPTIVEAQRTLKIMQKLIDRVSLFMNLDSQFIMKFNQITSSSSTKTKYIRKDQIDRLSPEVRELIVKQAKMESEFKTYISLDQNIRDGEVIEEQKLKQYERIKKDMAYTFRSLLRGLQKNPQDVLVLKQLKNSVANVQVSNIHEALSNYKIIMQKTLATAAEEEQSHTRLLQQLEMKIKSLDKTKKNCGEELDKLKEDRAKHAQQKKQQMDKLRSQIREVQSNRIRDLENIAKNNKQMSDTLARDYKKEEDSLKTAITQERNKFNKLREEHTKVQNTSRNNKLTNEGHLTQVISNYDNDMFKLSSAKQKSQKQLKRISDELNNLKRHFEQIKQQRKRQEALLEADRKRKHEWELMEKKRGEAATKIKEAFKLWKNKNKKKKKKKK